MEDVQCLILPPSSNELAECEVQNNKNGLKKISGDLETVV